MGLAESVSGLISRPQSAGYWDHDQQLIATTLPKFKILERMVNQPLYDDVNFDFRYWQTPISPDIDYKGLIAGKSDMERFLSHTLSTDRTLPVAPVEVSQCQRIAAPARYGTVLERGLPGSARRRTWVV